MALIVALVIAGLVAILAAITGGNFETQWLKIGRISSNARWGCGLLGIALVVVGIALSIYQTKASRQDSQLPSNRLPSAPSAGPIKPTSANQIPAATVQSHAAPKRPRKPALKKPEVSQPPTPVAPSQVVQAAPVTTQQCVDGSICNAGGTLVQAPQTVNNFGAKPPPLEVKVDGPHEIAKRDSSTSQAPYLSYIDIRTNTEWQDVSFTYRCDGSVTSFQPMAPQMTMLFYTGDHVSWQTPSITPKHPMRIEIESRQPITTCLIIPDP